MKSEIDLDKNEVVLISFSPRENKLILNVGSAKYRKILMEIKSSPKQSYESIEN